MRWLCCSISKVLHGAMLQVLQSEVASVLEQCSLTISSLELVSFQLLYDLIGEKCEFFSLGLRPSWRMTLDKKY